MENQDGQARVSFFEAIYRKIRSGRGSFKLGYAGVAGPEALRAGVRVSVWARGRVLRVEEQWGRGLLHIHQEQQEAAGFTHVWSHHQPEAES